MTPAYEGHPAEPKLVRTEHWWTAPARPSGDGADAPAPVPRAERRPDERAGG